MAVEFGSPAEELSQGDLFALVPSFYVRDLSYLVGLDKDRFRVQRWQPPSLNLDRDHPSFAYGVRRYAIALTHDCEIDKNPARASLLMAQVRPLTGISEKDRDGFRQNTRHRAFFLPDNPYIGEEAYADLRAITTIRRDALEQLSREASMNEDGRRMLREHVFRFFTRRILPQGWTDWDADE